MIKCWISFIRITNQANAIAAVIQDASYEAAILIDATHHLTDDENRALFKTLNRVAAKTIAICDPITQEKRKSYLEVWTRDVGNSNSRRKVIHLPFKYELSNGETGNGSHLTEENALEIMSHGEVELRYSKKDEYLVDELNKMEISKEVKIQIIENEIAAHLNGQYLLEMRYRVSKKIGASPDELKAITDELTKLAAKLDEWETVKSELEKESK